MADPRYLFMTVSGLRLDTAGMDGAELDMRKYWAALFCICLMQACSWESDLYEQFVDNDVIVPCPPTSFVRYDDTDDVYYLVCVKDYHTVSDDNGDYYNAPEYDYCNENGELVSVSDRVIIKRNRSGQFVDANNRTLYEWDIFSNYIKKFHQQPELSFVQITKKDDDNNIVAIRCNRNEKDNDDASACPDFSSAFAYNMCPKKYNVCLMDYDDKKNEYYYCKEDQVECKTVADCTSLVGWKTGECKAHECIATECDNRKDRDDWYHLVNSVCIADTPECCGATCSNCGANKCVKGECVSACEDNEHIYNDICEEDDIYNCGIHDNNCSRIIAGWESGECISKVCVPNSCILGYHLNYKEDSTVTDPCENKPLDPDTCHAANCECKGKDCRCSEEECYCDGADCQCTGKGCPKADCEIADLCSCTGVGCRCDQESSTCYCDGNDCQCTGDACLCDGGECGGCEEGETCETACTGEACFDELCKEHEPRICPVASCAEDVVECIEVYPAIFDAYMEDFDACVAQCDDEDETCVGVCKKAFIDKMNAEDDSTACWRKGYKAYCADSEDVSECEKAQYDKLVSCVVTQCIDEDYEYDTDCIFACLGESCPQKPIEMPAPDGPKTEKVSCEPDTTLQCGANPVVCACGEVCSRGECKSGCGSSEVLCKEGATYTCADPLTNVNYCGANGDCTEFTKCNEGETCFNGECKTQTCPNQGETLCAIKEGEGESESIVNKCINIMGSDQTQCGACNYVCAEHNLNNATSNSCDGGRCVYECNPGYIDCAHNVNNPNCILEANFATDSNNCGGCGKKCESNEYCYNGECVKSKCAAKNECLDATSGECVNKPAQCGTQCINCNTANNAAEGQCISGECKITKCAAGYHLNGDKCELDTNTACGANILNCNTNGNATAGVCTEGTCSATACKEKFHLDKGKCVADSDTACGSSTNNCKNLPGWNGGTCENATCKASSCKSSYCLSGTVCVDGVSNSKACGTTGGKCSVCTSGQSCISGACKTHPCAANTCYFQGKTCSNANEHCGTDCVNCNTDGHASAGVCNVSTGKCTIRSCAAGYHLYNNACEADSNTICGSGRTNCMTTGNATAGVCSNGSCVATACKTGYHLNNAGKCDADSINACAGVNCTKLPGWKSGSCTNGACKASACNANYCVSNGICVDGRANFNTCGISGGNCAACSGTQICSAGVCKMPCASGICFWQSKSCSNEADHCGTNCVNCNTAGNAKTGTCTNGVCKITACAAGYHLKNGACEIDSATACGTNATNCNSGNVTASVCSNGSCIATACKGGYHLNAGKCETDSASSCAGMNCTKLPGWNAGECASGVCKASSCKANFCLSSGTCVDGRANSNACGTSGNCTTCTSTQSCANGSCKTTSCASGTCFWQGTSCSNAPEHCGTSCVNCTLSISNWATGSCTSAGACSLTTCKAGYCVSNNACVDGKNNNNTCGKDGKACTKCPTGKTCQDGVCK